eukprot:NODE_512_length_7384_cov_0.221123.p1 type:complete len:1066 gc:universal NODE_512_length_7384_cov_0.221123:4495-1298(-)
MQIETVKSILANPPLSSLDPLDLLRDIEDDPTLLFESNVDFISTLTTLDNDQLMAAYTIISNATASLGNQHKSLSNCILYNYAVTRLCCSSYKLLNIKKSKKSVFNIDLFLVNLESFLDSNGNIEYVLQSIVDLFQFDLIQFNIPPLAVATILVKCLNNDNIVDLYKSCIPTIITTSDYNITQFANCLNELFDLNDVVVYYNTIDALLECNHKSLGLLITLLNNESFYQQLPLLIQFFNNSNPHVRVAITQSSMQLIINNQQFKNPHCLSHLLELIVERIHDVYATCRSKAISCVSQLISLQLFPLNEYCSITELIINRTKDKSHFTRKAAFKALKVVVKHHPFDKDGGSLDIKHCEDQIQMIKDYLSAAEVENVPSCISSLCNAFNPVDGSSISTALNTALVYYQSFHHFISLFAEFAPLFVNMLNSNKQQVFPIIDILVLLCQYGFNQSILKSVLNLVWSKDAVYGSNNLQSYIFDTFKSLFLVEDARISCKRLIEFFYSCNHLHVESFMFVLNNIQLPSDVVSHFKGILENAVTVAATNTTNKVSGRIPPRQVNACATILYKCNIPIEYELLLQLYPIYRYSIIIDCLHHTNIAPTTYVEWLINNINIMSFRCTRSAILLLASFDDALLIDKVIKDLNATLHISSGVSGLIPMHFRMLFIMAVLSNCAVDYVAMIYNKYHDKYQNTLQLTASNEDLFIQFIETVTGNEMFNNNEIFKGYADYMSWIARQVDSNVCDSVRNLIVYCLGKMMASNEQYCTHHVELYLHLSGLSAIDFKSDNSNTNGVNSISSNSIILLGEMISNFTNAMTPCVGILFKSLLSENDKIVEIALLQSTRLILQGLIKPGKFMGYLSILLIHSNSRIREITRGFFIELNSKDNSIYNNMMDIIGVIIDDSEYMKVIEYLLPLLKGQQMEMILEKCLIRLNTEHKIMNIIEYIVLFHGSGKEETDSGDSKTSGSCDRILMKLISMCKYYKTALGEADINARMIGLLQKIKNIKIENKLSLNDFISEIERMLVNNMDVDGEEEESDSRKKSPNKELKLSRLSISGMKSSDEEVVDNMEE